MGQVDVGIDGLCDLAHIRILGVVSQPIQHRLTVSRLGQNFRGDRGAELVRVPRFVFLDVLIAAIRLVRGLGLVGGYVVLIQTFSRALPCLGVRFVRGNAVQAVDGVLTERGHLTRFFQNLYGLVDLDRSFPFHRQLGTATLLGLFFGCHNL
ncbi:hypothetical protein D3C86_1024350 [compost metagenome]